ncbi:MAG TPA: transketolase, partial [Thermoanaerobaculia bacterium]|nr:transketolase [Thermoanaerobaculia bacterium]
MSPPKPSSSDVRGDAVSAAETDQLAIDTLRFLAVDMVEKANCGHPGAPMGQAPMAYWLWTRHLVHDPADPRWVGRDRFVLSSGHASALLYGLLHLAGYPLPMAELQAFRQLGSKTAGHPEHDADIGIETTTGPLGQGLANAVGMAIAERILAARYNREGFDVVDHRTWVIASDGDLMEGVTSEACSLAGHLRLGKLAVLYDSNGISIDGSTDLTFS